VLFSPPSDRFPLAIDKDFAGRQIVGSREEQQDAYAFSIVEGQPDQATHLLVVLADGMGGYSGGREASLAATQGFIDGFFASLFPQEKALPADAAKPQPAPALPISECLQAGLAAANASVDRLIETNPEELANAGTTLLALDLQPRALSWISVGDSPLFLWRKGKLQRLNQDHSMRRVLAEKVEAGQMPSQDLATHPERNMLLAALRGIEIEKVDAPREAFPLEPSDIILAASDGILTLSEKETAKILQKHRRAPATKLVRELLEAVNRKALPKQDNTTIALVRV
jgi:serine/threonine protein phosphatase PrpC